MVEFKMNTAKEDSNESVTDHYKVNARDFFVPTQVLKFRIVWHRLFFALGIKNFQGCNNV